MFWLRNIVLYSCDIIFFSSTDSDIHIKYYILKIRLNRHLLGAHLNKRKYTYSAFISCERRDCKYFVIKHFLPKLESKETQLQFCIAQRNFVVGVTILDNIMRAIHRSRKVVFIISTYFLESGWCKEELRIAHQVSVFTVVFLS